MPTYIPIEIGIKIKTSISNMLRLQRDDDRIVALFAVPHDERKVIQVEFEKALVVRIIDEMPLSTEREPTRIGAGTLRILRRRLPVLAVSIRCPEGCPQIG